MFLGRPMTIISLSRGNKQPAGDVIANVRVAGVLCDITKGQHCVTREHAGVCRRSASKIFRFFSITVVVRQLHSQAIQFNSPSFLLPFKEGPMSFHADGWRSDSVAMAIRGANSKSLHCFATGGWGDGERRVEPALCPSQRRQKQQVVWILRFFIHTLRPHFGPRKSWPASLPLRSPPLPARFQGQCETPAPFDEPEAGVLR